MYHLANEGSARAKQVLYVIANRERLIGALLLGNTFVNILASSLATSIALRPFHESGVVIAALVMTTIILIFGEVLPKTLAIVRTDRMALAMIEAAEADGRLKPGGSVVEYTAGSTG